MSYFDTVFRFLLEASKFARLLIKLFACKWLVTSVTFQWNFKKSAVHDTRIISSIFLCIVSLVVHKM